MRMKYWNLGLIIGVIALFSPGLFAASAKLCQTGPPTPASYTWNFPKEASGLLAQMRTDALQVRNIADTLQELDHQGENNFWQADAIALNSARQPVNAMDGMLCRLETIRRVSAPWEKRAIGRIAPSVIELSDTTQATIQYLNNNHDALIFPAYTDEAQVMYNKANRIIDFVDQYNRRLKEQG
jgi:hypothetical protein